MSARGRRRCVRPCADLTSRSAARAGHRARARASLALAIAPGVARPPDLPPARASARTAREFDVLKLRTMVDGAEHIGAGLAIDAGDARITRVGALLRRTSLDELPNLVNVLRGEMSLIGPRPTLPVQVEQYTERQRGRLAVKPGHHRLGAGQRPRVAAVGRADRARPLVHRAPLAGARPRRSCAHGARWCSAATGLYKGERRRLGGRAVSAPAVLLDRASGKRYDIVSCFAPARDGRRGRPEPARARAVRGARTARAVPRIDDPGYVPALAGAVRASTTSGAVLPLTDLDIEVLAPRARGRAAAGARAAPEVARATYDKYETHLLLSGSGCPRRRPCCPGDLEALDYPVMVKPRRGSGARSIHLARRPRAGALLRRLRATSR